MKHHTLYTLFALSFALFIWSASSGGRATVAGEGNTGAPGDATTANGAPKTCVTCHSSSSTMSVSLQITVLDDNDEAITSYEPGQTYKVRVAVTPTMGMPQRYGFQMVALQAPEGQNGPALNDSWANPSDNAKIAQASNGRKYVEQKAPSSTNEFSVDWTAPAAGSGPVTFYACGNGVNNNGSNSGDAAACTTLSLSESAVNAAEEVEVNTNRSPLAIAPNPYSGGSLSLWAPFIHDGQAVLTIFDYMGKQIAQYPIQIDHQQGQITLSNLPAGVFLLTLQQSNTMYATRLVKMR